MMFYHDGLRITDAENARHSSNSGHPLLILHRLSVVRDLKLVADLWPIVLTDLLWHSIGPRP